MFHLCQHNDEKAEREKSEMLRYARHIGLAGLARTYLPACFRLFFLVSLFFNILYFVG